MARLIDADELKEKLKDMDIVLVKHDVEDWIDEQPTVDAEPVRHGKWILYPDNQSKVVEADDCSVCGAQWIFGKKCDYCPSCGAKMDGE